MCINYAFDATKLAGIGKFQYIYGVIQYINMPIDGLFVSKRLG